MDPSGRKKGGNGKLTMVVLANTRINGLKTSPLLFWLNIVYIDFVTRCVTFNPIYFLAHAAILKSRSASFDKCNVTPCQFFPLSKCFSLFPSTQKHAFAYVAKF